MKLWNLEQFSDKRALVDDAGVSVTYRELAARGDRLADAAGTRALVFLLCTNSIGSVLGYTSLLELGILPVLLSAHLERELLCDLLRHYEPQYVWLPEKMQDDLLQPGDSDMERVYGDAGYALLKNKCARETVMNRELALLLTTSGSTGSPKFVRQSYTNVRTNAESIAAYLKLDETERPISTLPMNYTYGLSIINSHLLVGATLLLTDCGLMQKDFWRFLKEQAATSFGGVPYTYEMLERLRFFRMDLPSLRTMTQAGGKLTPELHKRFAEYAAEAGKNFIVMYGQCEATARMGYLPAKKALEKCGSMGIAIPGGKFYLTDENGGTIETPYTEGELVYEGKNVTMGYAECRDDLAKGDERGGVLHTGDIALFDEDGYYYITGRLKRFLKIYGNRVNLDETERLLKGRFGELELACTGVDDHMYLFVTDAAMAKPVRQYAAEKTGLNPAAFQAVVVDRIPKNDSGKTLYQELARLCAAGADDARKGKTNAI